MRLLDFNRLLENTELRESKIEEYTKSQIIREEASYASKYKFDKNTVEDLRLKAILFVNKAKTILNG